MSELEKNVFQRNLEHEMKILKLSPSDLGEGSGLGKTTIYGILKSKDFRFSSMLGICNFLKVSLKEMVDPNRLESDANKIHINDDWKYVIGEYNSLNISKKQKMMEIIQFHLNKEVGEMKKEIHVKKIVDYD